MAHSLPGFLTSRLAGAAGLQTDLPHFRRPLPVMVTAARRPPVGLLPDMRHFMGERREDHLVSTPGKSVRVEGELMNCGLIDAAVKPFRGKVASRFRMALQCHQHLGQAAAEQFTVEKVVGLLEPLIFGLSKSCCLHDCIGPYNSSIVKRFQPCRRRNLKEVGCRGEVRSLRDSGRRNTTIMKTVTCEKLPGGPGRLQELHPQAGDSGKIMIESDHGQVAFQGGGRHEGVHIPDEAGAMERTG
jgi:hypothetical protein